MRFHFLPCICLVWWTFWTEVNAFGVARAGRFPILVGSAVAVAKRQSVVLLRTTHEDLSESSVSSLSSLKQSMLNLWNDNLRNKSTAAVVTGLALYYLYKGFLSASGSSRFWKREGGMIVPPLSVASWSGELIGLVTLSKSMVFFLAAIARLSPLQCTALSALPIVFFMIYEIMTGSLDFLGFSGYFAPLVILYGSLVNVLVFTKYAPRDSLRKYMYVPLTIAGLLSWLVPEKTSSVVGIELKTAMDKILWVFLGKSLLSSSALLYTLLYGKGPRISKAMRNMTAVTALTTVMDVIFIRGRVLLEAGFSFGKAYQFISLSLSSSMLLLFLLGTS